MTTNTGPKAGPKKGPKALPQKGNTRDGWRAFWQRDRLAACVPENPASAALIEAHWTNFFAALPDGTRVLDVATGNGVLLLWAARAARAAGVSLSLTGVDQADIDPLRFLPEHRKDLEAITFLGDTAAESLPFADGSFDLVVSQYGLEYATLSNALGEARRVLRAGGQLHWLAHTDGSAVVRQGREQLTDIEVLLGTDGPFEAMEEFLWAHGRGRKIPQATAVLTKALQQAEAHSHSNPPATLLRQLCKGILDTANSIDRFDAKDAQSWLQENARRLREQYQRVSALQAASLNTDRRAEVEGILRESLWEDSVFNPLGIGAAKSSVGVVISASASASRNAR